MNDDFIKDKLLDLTLIEIIQQISRSIIDISYIIRKSNPNDLSSISGIENKSGDFIKELDSRSNDILLNNLKKCKNIAYIATEEESSLIEINKNGKYLVSFDPLDGSSNIDCNITTGTIFCIFEITDTNTLGKNIVSAGYSLYSSSTQLIIAKYGNISIYTLDPNDNKWDLITENFKMNENGSMYAINTSRSLSTNLNLYIEQLNLKSYTMRWVGSLVADFHRTLIKGGIVAYPNDNYNKCKIRLLYEAFPLAYIIEKADGLSSNGTQSILDTNFNILIDDIHTKIPIYFGSYDEMNLLLDHL